MKLSHKTSLYLLAAALFVFLISGVVIYHVLQAIIQEEVDGELAEQKILLLKEFDRIKRFEQYLPPKDSTIVIGEIVAAETDTNNIFLDAFRYTPFDDELVPFRVVTFPVTLTHETRMVSIYWSTIENDELREGIFFSLVILFAFIFSAIAVINYLSLHRIWLPFRKILEQIKNFNFRRKDGFRTIPSNIDEFQELNHELIQLTQKLTRDYITLKEFSENASHEMQTPLAIIQSKLELLFQDKSLKKENLMSLNAAYQAANRLSRLYHELNLLIRIENKEFEESELINFNQLVENQIENFHDIITMKQIKLNLDLSIENILHGNVYLLDILLSNLLNNAIKHNMRRGKIDIQLKEKQLIISNSGKQPTVPVENLFERFRKGNPASDSTGLGLSIVKQICDYHRFNITYSLKDTTHTISITL